VFTLLPLLIFLTQVRHLWTSISNIVHPSQHSDIVTASSDVAEMSGHSVDTHVKVYGSHYIGAEDVVYNQVHKSMGDNSLTPREPSPLSDDELLFALRKLYGPGASYLSTEQGDLVRATAKLDKCHTFGGLVPGEGKSAAWNIPVAASNLTGKTLPSIWVVCPYNFLVEYHVAASLELLQSQNIACNVVGILSNDVDEWDLPDCLDTDGPLPDVVILSVDAMSKLHEHYPNKMEHWVKNGSIHKFIVDEIHSLYGETFRDVNAVIPALRGYGLSVIVLSGSVPKELIRPLMGALGLDVTATLSQSKIITQRKFLGPYPKGFKIDVRKVRNNDVVDKVVEAVLAILNRDPNACVHVLCSTVDETTAVASRVNDVFPDAAVSLSSGTSKSDQRFIARKWRRGEIRILCSTTVALVGNENPLCHYVIVCGLLFNMFALVQGMGRLRKNQLTDSGSIEVIVPMLPTYLKNQYTKDDEDQMKTLFSWGLIVRGCRTYSRAGTRVGLYEWVDERACRVKSLAAAFSLKAPPCEVCDYCRDPTPDANVRQMASVARQLDRERVENRRSANRLFEALRVKCLLCKNEECNGESHACFRSKGLCGRCHQRHSNGPVRCKYEERSGMSRGLSGCYFCQSMNSVFGFHQPPCPMQKRLKRLIGNEVYLAGGVHGGTTEQFHDKLIEIFSNEANYCRYLAQLNRKYNSGS